MSSLWQLTALRRLELYCSDCTGSWHGLAALSRLQHLGLSTESGGDSGARSFPGLPAALSTLTALTFLDVETVSFGWSSEATSDDEEPPQPVELIRCQHLLPLHQLQHLSLTNVASSADVAAALPALMALTRLHCHSSPLGAPADVDWQQLSSVTGLKHLELCYCGLTAVPEQVSALTTLTGLCLFRNPDLVGGWQHLLPLTGLRDLSLYGVPLPDGVPPEVAALPALERLQHETLRL